MSDGQGATIQATATAATVDLSATPGTATAAVSDSSTLATQILVAIVAALFVNWMVK